MSIQCLLILSICKIGLDTAENEPSKVCHKGLTAYKCTTWIPYSQPRFRFIWSSALIGEDCQRAQRAALEAAHVSGVFLSGTVNT